MSRKRKGGFDFEEAMAGLKKRGRKTEDTVAAEGYEDGEAEAEIVEQESVEGAQDDGDGAVKRKMIPKIE